MDIRVDKLLPEVREGKCHYKISDRDFKDPHIVVDIVISFENLVNTNVRFLNLLLNRVEVVAK